MKTFLYSLAIINSWIGTVAFYFYGIIAVVIQFIAEQVGTFAEFVDSSWRSVSISLCRAAAKSIERKLFYYSSQEGWNVDKWNAASAELTAFQIKVFQRFGVNITNPQ